MFHAPRPTTCTMHTSNPPTSYYYTTGLRTIRRTSAALARSRCLGARKERLITTAATAVATLSMGQPRKTARSSRWKLQTGCRSSTALPTALARRSLLRLLRRSAHVVQVRSICSEKTLFPRQETLHSQDCCANCQELVQIPRNVFPGIGSNSQECRANSQELVTIPRNVVLIPRNW